MLKVVPRTKRSNSRKISTRYGTFTQVDATKLLSCRHTRTEFLKSTKPWESSSLSSKRTGAHWIYHARKQTWWWKRTPQNVVQQSGSEIMTNLKKSSNTINRADGWMKPLIPPSVSTSRSCTFLRAIRMYHQISRYPTLAIRYVNGCVWNRDIRLPSAKPLLMSKQIKLLKKKWLSRKTKLRNRSIRRSRSDMPCLE